MKKILSILMVFVVLMTISTAYSQGESKNAIYNDEGSEKYNWSDGKNKEQVYVASDEIAIFTGSRKNVDEIIKNFDQRATLVKDYGFVAIVNLPNKLDAKTLEDKARKFKNDKGIDANLVFYRGQKSDQSRMVLTGDIVVRFKQGLDDNRITQWTRDNSVQMVEKLSFVPNTYIFRAGPGVRSLEITNQIYQSGDAIYAYPNWWKEMSKKTIPNDPLFVNQWHLKNTGQGGGTTGEDVNITSIWDTFKGSNNGVIAIVDDGLEIGHIDISPNVLNGYSYDYVDGDTDPTAGTHGTSVGGVAAARGFNGIGVSGTAPYSKLIGYRLLDAWTTSNEADVLTRNGQVADIYSNSWGPSDDRHLESPGLLTIDALTSGTTNGRGGKGSIYTWAGGNGNSNTNNLFDDNSNYDGYANSRYIMAIAASNNYGTQSYYSEDGANILVNTPSNGGSLGITTTDRTGGLGYSSGDYTNSFGGTSSATPLASGIISLMLQANPNLGWRDVRLILAETAEKNNPSDSGWTTNGAGYHINHKYGFGRIDSGKAINTAIGWTNVGPEVSKGLFRTPNMAIPDNNAIGVFDTIAIDQNIKIEFVEIYFTSDHPYWGDLDIELVSPSGTKSKLAIKHYVASGYGLQRYDNWTFGSVRYIGESSQGTWRLNVKDLWALDTGTFQKWGLKIYGTDIGGGTVNPPLYVTVSESTDPVMSGGTSQVTTHAESDCIPPPGGVCATVLTPVEGASVSMSTTGGTLTSINGVTDTNGNFTTTYTAPSVTTSRTYTISATASMSGYTNGQGSDQITVNPQPGQSNVVISSARFDALGTDTQYNINGEYINIKNKGIVSQNITGWKLLNKTNNILYTIPTFTLRAGYIVMIYSGTGTNSMTRLYMKYNKHVWNNTTECARLKDKNDNLISEYCI